MESVVLQSRLEGLLGVSKPVSFREFVSGKDYCGNSELYDYWYARESELVSNLSELVLDGSIGGGKSYFASYYLAYRIYLLFHSGNPQVRLGLSSDSDISVLYFSVSLSMAKKSGFQYLYNIFSTCKWFNDNAPINKNLRSSIEFIGRHFSIDYASGEGHQIGLNVWGFILDEANFKSSSGVGVGSGVEEQYKAVTLLYEQLLDRQLSRYARPDGSVEALAILISSASYQSSFVERRKSVIKGSKTAHIITSRSYETKPHCFSSERFMVFVGAGSVEPCIIESEEHRLRLLRHAGILGTGEEGQFILSVPENLREAFNRNIVLALQNHCGVPTNLSSSFMSNLRYLYDSYVEECEIPSILQSFELEASTGDDTELIEYLVVDNIRYADRPHSIFIDASIQHDTASIVCFRYDGKGAKGEDLHTRVFSLKVRPPQFPNQTRLSKLQRFVIDIAGYLNVVCVGSDQYQSAEMRQEINALLGLEDIRISIDSSDIPHLMWQRGLVEGRIKQVRDELLEREVREAVHDWKKHRVLKAVGSTDDVLQGNCGAFYLSDTIGKQLGSVSDLYEGSISLTSSASFRKFLQRSGYQF